ncbi:conserved hypothetical protein [Talaromyces stipitatus ATCC 10500]|uniref:Uncharacterized protein n=1 Tax=Talaromyces stipitatus (strain ATCC 10500 / CBS 375.48 / QM 6759 / NRRL 1006) TaxID=441959 RepID=B8M9I6_TALSN|nr:uncharacterized protein TSTA_117640 [Talaromyces stipitatus ATCC 10500]EED17988.1 conserved hypothetical protein [Talaromyces stipitatus ATCC 10500]
MDKNGGLQPPTVNELLATKGSRRSVELDNVGNVFISKEGLNVSAEVNHEGLVDIHLIDKVHKFTKHLQKDRKPLWSIPTHTNHLNHNEDYEKKFKHILTKYTGVTRLNIAIHIVGSRGDVQPFIAIGQILTKPPYGHRVRICTHPVFKDFVEENGLEFFSIGGDPSSLMAYMVKNPGLLPGKESWKSGDVGKRRAEFSVILEGCWRSCIESGNGMEEDKEKTSDNGTDTQSEDAQNAEADRAFIADVIIANPPSYGHIHCAEKLGIPLHIMFTMPWSPTQYFPHPLASIQGNKADPKLANYMSYTIMELLAWQGLGDIINGFRMKTLHLDAISPLWGHMLLSRMKIPFTYTWSSALIPKPVDWGSHINITGFPFLKIGSDYTSPKDLADFLAGGPPPVYIGFGSIVVDNPEELTRIIFGAVKRAGVRALVSQGWGGLGGKDVPENIFLLGNCPHDWLFQHVSCVVHHGGAGTTAIGIAMGRPTIVIPFFGDQPFWGSMIHRANAGPEPVPFKSLTEEKLAESIIKALQPDIQASVLKLSAKIAGESGNEAAAASFHNSISYDSMRCLLRPEDVAIWRVKKTNIRLGFLAATTLVDNKIISLRDLTMHRHQEWHIDEGAAGPVMGFLAFVSDTVVKTWDSVHSYARDISRTIHRKSEPQGPIIPMTERRSFEQDYPENGTVFSQPVTAALSYSPNHLERVAYRMVSGTLPDFSNSSKYRKTPRITRTNTFRSLLKKNKGKHRSKVEEFGSETAHFAYSVLRTGLHGLAPVALFYNLANGFHNAPNFILKDETVRKRGKITGLRSGIKVAGKSSFLNLYDAVTGLVIHPYRDTREYGVEGIGKGIGRGIGGLFFKSIAAAFGLPGYCLKGLEKQIEKRDDRDLRAQILQVRIIQGLAAYRRASEEDKQEILRRWNEAVAAESG